jgi:[ribosomal protein S18]-alanine N-acetyltransferase
LLRIATPEDLAELYRIEVACFREGRFRPEHVEWIVTNPHALTLVIPGPEGFLGSIMLLFERNVCRVLSVAVMPYARRKGYGTEMMHAAEEAARSRACSLVRLEVSTLNTGAVEFYRRLGYAVDGVLYGYYSWGEDAYSMAKRVLAESRASAPSNIHASE